jgi:hypothetical protein
MERSTHPRGSAAASPGQTTRAAPRRSTRGRPSGPLAAGRVGPDPDEATRAGPRCPGCASAGGCGWHGPPGVLLAPEPCRVPGVHHRDVGGRPRREIGAPLPCHRPDRSRRADRLAGRKKGRDPDFRPLLPPSVGGRTARPLPGGRADRRRRAGRPGRPDCLRMRRIADVIRGDPSPIGQAGGRMGHGNRPTPADDGRTEFRHGGGCSRVHT